MLPDADQPGRNRSAAIVAATSVILLLMAAAVVVGFVILRGGSGEAVRVPAFTVGEGEASIVPATRIQVTASSVHQPDFGITYVPENTLDGDLSTAWNSEAAADQGRSQTLTYRFSEPVDLHTIHFVNGYAKSDEVFDANHRVKELMVITDSVTQAVSLADNPIEQEVTFNFGLTSKVMLEITDVYPGSGFSDPSLSTDLALTEVVFVAVQR